MQLAEPYRTLLGHLRHEVGHWYWTVLVDGTAFLDRFRDLFGDERLDYQAALEKHYADVDDRGWTDTHVSHYAAAHPWEDWAETFAHYLHIRDTMQTAKAWGIHVAGPDLELAVAWDANLAVDPVDDPGDFDELARAWLAFTFALNAVNHSMGHDALYPFVLTPKVAGEAAVRARRGRGEPMRWTVLVPLRSLPSAKSRLASTVPAELFEDLVDAIRADTLAAVRAAGPVARVVVVGDRPADGVTLVQTQPGLNGALRDGAAYAGTPLARRRRRGPGRRSAGRAPRRAGRSPRRGGRAPRRVRPGQSRHGDDAARRAPRPRPGAAVRRGVRGAPRRGGGAADRRAGAAPRRRHRRRPGRRRTCRPRPAHPRRCWIGTRPFPVQVEAA